MNLINEVQAVHQIIGSKRSKSSSKDSFWAINMVRSGLQKHHLLNLASAIQMSIPELANYLPVTARSIQRFEDEETLKPAITERVLEIASVYSRGFSVFGEDDRFIKWMNTANVALGGIPPKHLLDTSFGISFIKDELGRIENGILA